MIRKPIVNGQFYPQEPDLLKSQISQFKPEGSSKISAKGLILPHAGYLYSGRVATVTVSKIIPKKTVVILGPNHTGLGPSFSLWDEGSWKIPSNEINIDENLAKAILSKGSYVSKDFSAHENEHSIEVQLPIINYFFNDFKLVPIACKTSNLETYKNIAAQIYEGLKGSKDEVLLVASTDLTHYEPDQLARKKDRSVIEALINLDEEELIKKIHEENITMCGEAPVAILIACLKKIGVRKSQVALYQTSGDSGGDKTSVVGYVGMIIN